MVARKAAVAVDVEETPEVAVEQKTEPKPGELNIYQIIARITREAGALAPVQAGGVPFAFRGISDTINHLSPYLKKYGAVIIPEVLEHVISSREISGNKAITQTAVTVRYTVYAPDGTSVSGVSAGLAQDYADRSTAQALSVAMRVFLLQTFALPTNDPEPEAHGQEVQAYIANAAASAPAAPAAPTVAAPTVAELKGKVAALLKARDIVGAKGIKEYGNKFFAEQIAADASRANWGEVPQALAKLITHLESGVVKEGVDD
jgi:hypothetical protein